MANSSAALTRTDRHQNDERCPHHHILGQLISFFPDRLAVPLSSLPDDIVQSITEIRINLMKPLIVRTSRGDHFVSKAGRPGPLSEAITVTKSDVDTMMSALTSSSVYAVVDSLREGYLRLPGGHRVGLAGEIRTERETILGFRHVSAINIRVSRPMYHVSRPILRSIVAEGGTVYSTLIIAPPGGGKTTLLRDLIRTLSYGLPSYGIKPHRVSVADERGEIGGGSRGVHGFDLGPRTDVIELCSKRFALNMLIRSMGAEIAATDEIGHPDDAVAIMDALRAGVVVVCTAHGATVDQIRRRPSLKPLWEQNAFQRIVILSDRHGPGTLERIVRWEKH